MLSTTTLFVCGSYEYDCDIKSQTQNYTPPQPLILSCSVSDTKENIYFDAIKTRTDKYFTNLILCDGSLRREEVVADPVSKADVFNRFLSPENSISVYFYIAVFSLKILARLVNKQDVHKVIPVYLAGSRYLLLISTGSTFMKIEEKC